MRRIMLMAGVLLCVGCPWLKVVLDVATTVKDICEAVGAGHTIRTGGATLSCPPHDMGLTDGAADH